MVRLAAVEGRGGGHHAGDGHDGIDHFAHLVKGGGMPGEMVQRRDAAVDDGGGLDAGAAHVQADEIASPQV
jgi:hypothetical protein